MFCVVLYTAIDHQRYLCVIGQVPCYSVTEWMLINYNYKMVMLRILNFQIFNSSAPPILYSYTLQILWAVTIVAVIIHEYAH